MVALPGGTYAPDADNRWMGAIAMDGLGNIALGYNVEQLHGLSRHPLRRPTCDRSVGDAAARASTR